MASTPLQSHPDVQIQHATATRHKKAGSLLPEPHSGLTSLWRPTGGTPPFNKTQTPLQPPPERQHEGQPKMSRPGIIYGAESWVGQRHHSILPKNHDESLGDSAVPSVLTQPTDQGCMWWVCESESPCAWGGGCVYSPGIKPPQR